MRRNQACVNSPNYIQDAYLYLLMRDYAKEGPGKLFPLKLHNFDEKTCLGIIFTGYNQL